MTTNLNPKAKPKLERPKQYVVKFLNDDFTPMDFVVAVMTEVFKMGVEEAEQKTMEVHTNGHAVHGPMTHEVAETRVTMAAHWARAHEMPFRCEVAEA